MAEHGSAYPVGCDGSYTLRIRRAPVLTGQESGWYHETDVPSLAKQGDGIFLCAGVRKELSSFAAGAPRAGRGRWLFPARLHSDVQRKTAGKVKRNFTNNLWKFIGISLYL